MSGKLRQPRRKVHSASQASKPFYKIGEVASMLGVKPHVLRYWEVEFASLRPKKNPSGQRIYAQVDIDALVEIKNLLYNERYTISGAKQLLAQQARHSGQPTQDGHKMRQGLQELKQQIQDLLALLQ